MEVIPNSVAVISLNTMYFYDSNAGTSIPHARSLHWVLTSRYGDQNSCGRL